MLELALVLFSWPFGFHAVFFFAHIVEIRMNSLSVLFRDTSSSSFFSSKLFKVGDYANSLDHLDCSHGILAVFYNKNVFSESKFLSPPMKAVGRTCTCAISLDHLHFRMFMFCSQGRNQDEFTVSFILRQKFTFLFFKEAVRIWSLCEFSWSFGLQSWCTGSILW